MGWLALLTRARCAWIYSRGREGGSAPTAYHGQSGPGASYRGPPRWCVGDHADRGLPADGGDAMSADGQRQNTVLCRTVVLRHAARQGAGDVIFDKHGRRPAGPSLDGGDTDFPDQGGGTLLADAASVVVQSWEPRRSSNGPARVQPDCDYRALRVADLFDSR